MPALSRAPRLLLVSVNRERMPYPVAPLGLAYATAAARAAGAEVFPLDLCFSTDPLAELASAVRDAQPDLIGLSVRNLDTATYPRASSSLPYLSALVAPLKETGRPVLLAGSGFSVAPAPMLAALGLDYGIRGEGEPAVARLVEALRGGEPLSVVPGMVHREGGGFVANAAAPADLARLVRPDRSAMDNARYWSEGGMANVQTKRGCAFRCVYCSYPVLEGRSFRQRDPADVADEVEGIHRELGIDYVFFVDSIFNVPAPHARAVCQEMRRRNLPVRWSCYLTPAEATEELVETMASAGCREMEWGVDSGSSEQLLALKKSFGVDQVRRVAGACRARGIAFSCDLILGGPGETEETLRTTFALMDEIEPTAVIAMVGVRLYPGTEAERSARADGTVGPEADLLEPTFAFSRALPAERTLELLYGKASSDPRWIVPGIGANLSPEVLARLRRMGRAGPLWELISKAARPRPGG